MGVRHDGQGNLSPNFLKNLKNPRLRYSQSSHTKKCVNFRNLLPELSHWHVPNLLNGESHALLWIHPDSHHRIIPESEPLELPKRPLLGSPSYNDQHLMDLAAHGCNKLFRGKK